MKSKLLVFLLFAFGLVLSTDVFGEEDPKSKNAAKAQSPPRVAGTDPTEYGMININNFTVWLEENGRSGYNPFIGGNGGVFPAGTAPVIFQDGFIFGARLIDSRTGLPAPTDIRVGGGTYATGWQKGAAPLPAGGVPGVDEGVPEDVKDPSVRLYRIRRDYTDPGTDLRGDAALYFQVAGGIAAVTDADVAALKALYDADWKEWPVAKGAPFVDRNGNGIFDPPPAGTLPSELIAQGLDEPGLAAADLDAPADQVIWTVVNDFNDTFSKALYGSPSTGMELQITLWGYKRTDALGSIVFRKYRLINRGFFESDSFFVAQWSDPDLGSYGDDFVGFDTTLSMAFVYNSNSVDSKYRLFGLPPAAGGYDFFQGPLVPGDPSDVGIFDLKKRPGFRNLPMTSTNFWSAGSPLTDPPLDEYEGTLSWWKMLRGFIHDESTDPDRKFIDDQGVETLFPLSGDPVAGTGWIDGVPPALPTGDRRMTMVSGPFTMVPGDTQEVVVAVVGGLGADRLSSISVMKFNDRFAQNTYNDLFAVPSPPSAPPVTIAELDQQIVLDWGDDFSSATKIETTVTGTYEFQGYNVYQFPKVTSTLADGVKLATFDLVDELTVILDDQFDVASGQILRLPVQDGSNSGIVRQLNITADAVTGGPTLNNGQEYFLAVTSYTVSTDEGATPRTLESPPNILIVIPQSAKPGVTLAAFGDTLVAAHVGPSDGRVLALVVDPTLLTGNTYEVRFDTLTGNIPVWNLINTTTGETLLANQTNQTGDDSYFTADGIQWKVFGAPNDFKSFQVVANGAGPIDPPEPGALEFDGFPVPTDPVTGDALRPSDAQQVGAGHWAFHTGDDGAGTRGTYEKFLERSMRGDNFDRLVPFDWEMRFTAAGSFAVQAFTTGFVVSVPFELWNIGVDTPTDPSDDYQLIPYFLELEAVGGVNIDPLVYSIEAVDHSGSGGTNDPFTPWIYWKRPVDFSAGTAGYDAYVAQLDFSTTPPNSGTYALFSDAEIIARSVLINWNGGDVTDPTWPANANQLVPEEGTIFRLISTKPNALVDVFSITVPDASFLQAQAVVDVEKINVFPNPYFAFNTAEVDRFVRFVTFNFLPAKATIRIFNVAGQQVRKLEKDDDTQFARWNLTNESNFPVGSGMYIVHIDMPDIGATKILKLGVIQEQEILEIF